MNYTESLELVFCFITLSLTFSVVASAVALRMFDTLAQRRNLARAAVALKNSLKNMS